MCLIPVRRRWFRGDEAFKVFILVDDMLQSPVTRTGPYVIGESYRAQFPPTFGRADKIYYYLNYTLFGLPRTVDIRYFHAYLNRGTAISYLIYLRLFNTKIIKVRLYGSGYEGDGMVAAPRMELIEEVDATNN